MHFLIDFVEIAADLTRLDQSPYFAKNSISWNFPIECIAVLHFHTIFQSSRENSAHDFELLLVNQFEGWRKGIAWKGWQKLQIIKYVEFAFNIWVKASHFRQKFKKKWICYFYYCLTLKNIHMLFIFNQLDFVVLKWSLMRFFYSALWHE